MDMVAVLIELERQKEVALAIKLFIVIRKQDWYKPGVYLYKDLIIALARCKKMDDVMGLWESMREDNPFTDSQTYAEVIRGFWSSSSPGDAMNIYEDMKKSPDPPEELPFRILLKGHLPHPLLRNRVKQDFEELLPEKHMYGPPEEIFDVCRVNWNSFWEAKCFIILTLKRRNIKKQLTRSWFTYETKCHVAICSLNQKSGCWIKTQVKQRKFFIFNPL